MRYRDLRIPRSEAIGESAPVLRKRCRMPSPLVKAREGNATDERPRPECAEKIRTKVFGPIYRIGLYERCDWSSHGITLRILRGGAKRQSDYGCGNRDNCSNGRHISAALVKLTCGSAPPSEHPRPSRPCPAESYQIVRPSFSLRSSAESCLPREAAKVARINVSRYVSVGYASVIVAESRLWGNNES